MLLLNHIIITFLSNLIHFGPFWSNLENMKKKKRKEKKKEEDKFALRGVILNLNLFTNTDLSFY